MMEKAPSVQRFFLQNDNCSSVPMFELLSQQILIVSATDQLTERFW